VLLEVRLFALARERVGQPSVVVELPESPTVGMLKEVLAATQPALAPLIPHLRFAINSEYAEDAMVIPSGAEAAAIPPVSGGQVP
jgi:molybdopterin synthase catalytic subunit